MQLNYSEEKVPWKPLTSLFTQRKRAWKESKATNVPVGLPGLGTPSDFAVTTQQQNSLHLGKEFLPDSKDGANCSNNVNRFEKILRDVQQQGDDDTSNEETIDRKNDSGEASGGGRFYVSKVYSQKARCLGSLTGIYSPNNKLNYAAPFSNDGYKASQYFNYEDKGKADSLPKPGNLAQRKDLYASYSREMTPSQVGVRQSQSFESGLSRRSSVYHLRGSKPTFAYADPIFKAPESFLRRLARIEELEQETVRFERNKKIRKKKSD